mmetsp:Transcript_5905/g.12940  ORF Transcript_5905/g.12940 Transcript_5905/m.12940 type:complete len:86 (-) Transcript_5905:107-364(-)
MGRKSMSGQMARPSHGRIRRVISDDLDCGDTPPSKGGDVVRELVSSSRDRVDSEHDEEDSSSVEGVSFNCWCIRPAVGRLRSVSA